MSNEKARISVRVDADLKDKIQKFSSKHADSTNDFLLDAIDYYMKYLEGEYDVPNALVQRVNQLVDMQVLMNQRMSSLEDVVHGGINSLMTLSRGSGYLDD